MEIVKNTSKEVRVQGQMVQILIDHAMNVHESCMKLCLDKSNPGYVGNNRARKSASIHMNLMINKDKQGGV